MEKELDMIAINKIYNMISSSDVEMRDLGISIADSYGIVGDSVSNITTVLASIAYQLGMAEAEKIRSLVRHIKSHYVKGQEYSQAVIYRDVERVLEELLWIRVENRQLLNQYGKSDSKKDSGSVDE